MNGGAQNQAPGGAPTVPEHELMHPIASGAYGQVWLARNTLGIFRAVKIVYRSSFDHDRPFEREFAGIKAFEPVSRAHQGLVDLLQVGRDDSAGYFYYVMELADATQDLTVEAGSNGEDQTESNRSESMQLKHLPRLARRDRNLEGYAPRTLASELKGRGALPLEECIRIGLSLTQALGYLHRQGLVHRDIKPSNIIFVDGLPKLADVGLVTAVGQSLSFVGTEGFIAPEGPGSPQADIYSLGIVLYVLSTGKSHQEFPEPPTNLSQQANHDQWLEFNAMVHKACQADVRQRFQSAQEMHAELRLLEAGESVRRKRAVRRRWLAARHAALSVLVLALLCLALPLLKRMVPGHTPNPEAVRLYELGRWHYNQLTAEDHSKALKYLTQALEKDPKFVQPYGELLVLYGWCMLPSVSTDQERLKETKRIAAKLMAIDPNLALGHAALSFSHFLERDWPGAEQEIRRAIAAEPDFAIAHFIYCFYLTLEGRTAEAEREALRAQALEPPASARVSAIAAAWPFMAERRYDRAITQLQQVLDLDRNFAMGHDYLGDCYEAQSNYVAALEEYKSFALLSGNDPRKVAEVFGAIRQAYDTQGEQGYLRKWIEVMLADEAQPQDQQMFANQSDSDLAGYYARVGEKQKALEDLEKHFDGPNVWSQINFLPAYDSLHDEPRFKALVKRAGLGK